MSEYATQWVCIDCYVLLCNGDICDGVENPDVLLSKFEGFRAMPGMPYGEHQDGCARKCACSHEADCEEHGDNPEAHHDPSDHDYPDDYECDCEMINFSQSSCDGCGSPLHGERYAVTIDKI